MTVFNYQNGSPCPCCGEPLNGKDEAWLDMLNQFFNSLYLEQKELKPIKLPPDAGINPPGKPKF